MNKEFLKMMEAVPKIIQSGERNSRQMHTVAQVKRFLEWYIGDPDFRAAYEQAPSETLACYQLNVKVEDMDCLCKDPLCNLYQGKYENLPVAVQWYSAYMLEKIGHRNRLQEHDCVPKNPAFKAWRQRQLNRCWGELGSNNVGFIHVPLVFELSKGCSMGCEFCALASAKLEGIFRATTENSTLWRDILLKSREIIGDAAGSGVCYCATEPFDNPDYEEFSRIYQEIFGVVPQVTTAAAMRQPERTKKFLQEAAKMPGIHRFSVLTLELYREILQYFAPEELLFVELLPRFPEAAAYNTVTKAGRAREENGEESVAQTISCASGFIVNLVEKSIRLTTPCNADEAHPTGEIKPGQMLFTNSADFAEKMTLMINTYMPISLDSGQILRFQEYYTSCPSKEGFTLASKAKFRVNFQNSPEIKQDIYGMIGELIQQKKWTARQIASTLLTKNDIAPAETFYCINYLFKAGCLVEY
ncbi:radical SAM family RiPP maturation amino acid epimerase [Sporomusa sp. KB1]|uniref:radical SAM family RiPP maturation amino acid epimerase n=1 Tax=Sporomusa sp. KB1 TaxID=943346 RepID=UPI0011A008D5|nr:radical SAM family RiPP maturation amino acid epimerase [Sporomusa sp. KB1]TWH46394.1 radical SAM family RiPP maturation amino acid epimerase [Sporomusa sp. KB1]